jgi:hypothetical protein
MIELTTEEKNILIVGKFFKKFKKEFKTTEITLKSSNATKTSICNPQENIYPLIIYVMNWPLSYTFHWTGKKDKELGFKQMSEYITDKKGKKYFIEEMKEKIKTMIPEAFTRDFYNGNINLSTNIVDESYDAINKKLKAIKLVKELDVSLDKNSHQVIKKNKI